MAPGKLQKYYSIQTTESSDRVENDSDITEPEGRSNMYRHNADRHPDAMRRNKADYAHSEQSMADNWRRSSLFRRRELWRRIVGHSHGEDLSSLFRYELDPGEPQRITWNSETNVPVQLGSATGGVSFLTRLFEYFCIGKKQYADIASETTTSASIHQLSNIPPLQTSYSG